MAWPSVSPSTTSHISLLAGAAWRLAAGFLYAFSLLLIPHNLPAAVFVLLAALVCIPTVRGSLGQRAGFRIGGVAFGSAVTVLLGCAVMSSSWQVGPQTADNMAQISRLEPVAEVSMVGQQEIRSGMKR